MADTWYAPFSPLILKTSMPEPLLASISAAADALLSDPELCAQYAERSPVLYDVETRVELPGPTLEAAAEAIAWLQSVCTRYVHRVFEGLDLSELTEGLDPAQAQAIVTVAWINAAREGDFVPVHKHSSDLSGAVYLDVPPTMGGPSQRGGQLTFIDGRPQQLVREKLSLSPTQGDVLVFPGWLSHTVHPFRGPGERRMLSFNAIIAFPAAM